MSKKLSLFILYGIKSLITLLFFAVTISCVNANTLQEDSTIKELKSKIADLNNNQTVLTEESKSVTDIKKLKEFFKENLNSEDFISIENIITEYNSNRGFIYRQLIDKAEKLEDVQLEKSALLEEKKELYKRLLPYIKEYEIEGYLEYIKNDAKIYKEKKNLTEQIIVSQKILTNKVSHIEEKIKEHREILDEALKQAVIAKIDEKIENLKSNETFLSLANTSKQQVLEKTIEKVKLRETKLENDPDLSDVLIKKLEIYKILLLKLNNYKDSLNDKKEIE